MGHHILKVFAQDARGSELMLLGRLVIDFKNGTKQDDDFGALIETVDMNGPRMKLFQAWL